MANKKRYYHKNRAQKPDNAENSAIQQQTALYSSEQLSQSLQSLGVSEATCALLEKNRILTASDLVRRTEKDMYKVQGLNKKILFEVKDALKAHGMSLRPEQKPQNAQNDKAQKQDGKEQAAFPASGTAGRRLIYCRKFEPYRRGKTPLREYRRGAYLQNVVGVHRIGGRIQQRHAHKNDLEDQEGLRRFGGILSGERRYRYFGAFLFRRSDRKRTAGAAGAPEANS